eukprot:scaffold4164_cov431-Prasinococcus_capsulatus_cf.AAC.5
MPTPAGRRSNASRRQASGPSAAEPSKRPRRTCRSSSRRDARHGACARSGRLPAAVMRCCACRPVRHRMMLRVGRVSLSLWELPATSSPRASKQRALWAAAGTSLAEAGGSRMG